MSLDLNERRYVLRDTNIRASQGKLNIDESIKLDSSLKKHTALIKKLRTSINAAQCEAILKDINNLSLEKYISELITSVAEGLNKVAKNDVDAALEIVSLLHQRFPKSFTPPLISQIIENIFEPAGVVADQEKEKNDRSRILRQKNLSRVLMEFYLTGLVKTLGDCDATSLSNSTLRKFEKYNDKPIVCVVIKEILEYDFKLGNSLTIATVFLRRFSDVIYQENVLLDTDTKAIFRQLFKRYTTKVFDNFVSLNLRLKLVLERKKKSSIRTGKILDENLTEIEEVEILFEKFKSAAEFLSSALEMELPYVETFDDSILKEPEHNLSANFDASDVEVWGSEVERSFYNDIPKPSELAQSISPRLKGSSQGERISDFFDKLEKISNEKDISQSVVDFNSLDFNNKATRNRLLRLFSDTSKVNNSKFYARFLKINEQNLKDLIQELIEYLDNEFRKQILGSKLNFKHMSFFVELIKFKMVPSHIIFHKIRRLTLNIGTVTNIDVLAVFYDQAGRFLLAEPAYRNMMLEMLDLLQAKLRNESLTINEKLAIKNLLITVGPSPIKNNVASDSQIVFLSKRLFILKLLKVELKKSTISTVLSTLDKINKEKDPDAFEVLMEMLGKPEDLSFNNIPYLARLLKQRDGSVFTTVIDTVIEKILCGIESNDYKLNRITISNIQYISELFKLRCLTLQFMVNLMYKIICTDHPNNLPLPNNYKVISDLPNNYFRIQLCSILLKSIISLKSLVKESTLSGFVVFLQYYIFCKVLPLPVDIDNEVNTALFHLLDSMNIERARSIKDALSQLNELSFARKADENQKQDENVPEELDDFREDESDASLDDELNYNDNEDLDINDDAELDITDADADADVYDDEERCSSVSSYTSSDSGESTSDEDESDDEDSSSILENEEAKLTEEEREFSENLDKEFLKILSESYGQNKAATNRNKFHIPIPSRATSINSSSENLGMVTFNLLSKTGKKSQLKSVSLPSDSRFAENLVRERADQKQNREKLIDMVLNMEQ
ncbi:uncharacterized protein PRCAT00001339001 [Priceomyces carsonii]|uniref:uncharacterized protein n=1 Tax=Priceomyces carsonii TaxID=28549 RepID=UPI002ED80538|nr:unnamed protein product [Priceomyces carsonii]